MTLLHQDGQTEMNIVDSVTLGISIPLVITGEQAGVTCSFAGGCVHTITAQGLAAIIEQGDAMIKVCNRECVFREDLSSATEAACEIP